MTFNWTCKFCNRLQVATGDKVQVENNHSAARNSNGEHVGFKLVILSCANMDCRELTVSLVLGHWDFRTMAVETPIRQWILLPESSAKPQPEYIPEVLRNDYFEACRIRDLSPKASATLARRCVQGMIRDFCGISKRRLVDEINELRSRLDNGEAPAGVTPESVDAIDHVRSIGNIGAHMGEDVNVIIDVEPDEAQALIELIEMLFEEWYVARQQRNDRFAKISQIKANKEKSKIEQRATNSAKLLSSPSNS